MMSLLSSYALLTLTALTAIGYGVQGDTRRCLYFVFAFGINLTVVWK